MNKQSFSNSSSSATGLKTFISYVEGLRELQTVILTLDMSVTNSKHCLTILNQLLSFSEIF